MKKFATKVAVACMAAVAGLTFMACGGVETKDGGTLVHDASLTGWRSYQGEETGNKQYNLLDTSVVINFDELKIGDIDKITFELYKNDDMFGNAVSENEKLDALFQECLKYWKDSEQHTFDAVSDVRGNQTLSCNFYTLENPDEAVFDDIWTYSANSVKQGQVEANGVVVKVLVGNTEYVTEYTKAA